MATLAAASTLHHERFPTTKARMSDPVQQPTFTVAGNRMTMLDTGPRRLDALIALIDGD